MYRWIHADDIVLLSPSPSVTFSKEMSSKFSTNPIIEKS